MPNDSYYPRLHRPPSIFRVVNCRVGPRLRQRREKAAPRRKRCVEEIYDTKDLLHAVQGGLCAICGRPLDPVVHRATTDHVIPVAAGGKDALGNYVLAHGKCNEWKANDIPTGCEMIWLLFVNAKIGAKPVVF